MWELYTNYYPLGVLVHRQPTTVGMMKYIREKMATGLRLSEVIYYWTWREIH